MRPKAILNRLFTQPRPTTQPATIRRRLNAGRYELSDDMGRLIQADSTILWSPGARVIVSGGQITGGAAGATTIKTYEV